MSELSDRADTYGADPELGEATIAVAMAARRLVAGDKGIRLAALVDRERAALVGAVDRLEELLKVRREEEEGPATVERVGRWEAATWRDVRDGDRVRLPDGQGGYAEADVLHAGYREWIKSGVAEMAVLLSHRPDKGYPMKPSGPVEVWRPEVPGWAADAVSVLQAAGLQPEPIGVEEIPS